MTKKVKIYGSAVYSTSKPVSMHKREIVKATVEGKRKDIVDVSDIYGKKSFIDVSWLKAASTKYHISPNLNDYVVESVPVLTAGIPNINMQGFSVKALTEFDPDQGCVRYKTFVGKPTFEEHQNTDITKAKGVNLDASLVSIPKFKIGKVVVLSAFDRTKDEKLVSAIFKRERKSYSMGAIASYFNCSICSGILGPGVDRTCSCVGTDYTNLRSYGQVINGKLHYIEGADPVFIENSSVASPADVSAVGTQV